MARTVSARDVVPIPVDDLCEHQCVKGNLVRDVGKIVEGGK